MTFFPLRSQPPTDSSVHRIICIGHVYDNHFVRVYLKDHCPLLPLALLWSSNCHPQAKHFLSRDFKQLHHHQHRFIHMQRLDATEGAYDWKMKQRHHIIQRDGQLPNGKMETASFLVPPLHKSRYNFLIAKAKPLSLMF
ncbi:hypothetical protein GmHk_07G019765 [Glycine max]|nr:hypothetical protein GmHk_07G019765 [Glycine max]KAH1242424.1 hypothetical protein GmHk_07G019765 [Glycine max]KAH1242425.1 hypothetical protein GmHk_07G019765 [Glycine max]KAH1242426.1 hypothetical protein GmHk_07G019765 [Glycine max]